MPGRSILAAHYPSPGRDARHTPPVPQSRQGRPILAPRFNGGLAGGEVTSPVRDKRIPPRAPRIVRIKRIGLPARSPFSFALQGWNIFNTHVTHRWKRWVRFGRPWRDYRQGLAGPVNIGRALSKSRQGRQTFVPPSPVPSGTADISPPFQRGVGGWRSDKSRQGRKNSSSGPQIARNKRIGLRA